VIIFSFEGIFLRNLWISLQSLYRLVRNFKVGVLPADEAAPLEGFAERVLLRVAA
jgi:hypothetical protein